MLISRTIRKNNHQLYFSIPKDVAEILYIKEKDIVEIKIIKVHKK
jgi:hypothetical protein